MKMKTKNILLGLIVFVAIAAGGHLVLKGAAQKKPEKIGVAVQGFNYTYEGVQGFTVNDGAGANVTPYGGGGEVCCVLIPGKWTPELKATVRWTIGHFTKPWSERGHLTVEENIACCWAERTLEKTVPIEPYTEPGNIQVFFLANDEIKVYSHPTDPQHPSHPSKMGYPKNPNPVKEDEK